MLLLVGSCAGDGQRLVDIFYGFFASEQAEQGQTDSAVRIC
jgi:hypothetical protein